MLICTKKLMAPRTLKVAECIQRDPTGHETFQFICSAHYYQRFDKISLAILPYRAVNLIHLRVYHSQTFNHNFTSRNDIRYRYMLVESLLSFLQSPLPPSPTRAVHRIAILPASSVLGLSAQGVSSCPFSPLPRKAHHFRIHRRHLSQTFLKFRWSSLGASARGAVKVRIVDWS
jgi:hypothetical protein